MKLNKRLVKSIIVLCLSVTSILVMTAFGIHKNLVAKTTIEPTESLIEVQNRIDQEIDSSGYTIENPLIIINPYKISPLTALIVFETKTETAPKVIIRGKDGGKDISHTFDFDTKHYLPIYGLYANYNNTVIVGFENNDYTFTIKTDALPADLKLPINKPFIDENNKDNIEGFLYFVTPASNGYTSAYDINGEVRWYLTENMAWEISRLANGNLILSNERVINPPYYTTGLYEVSLLGKIYNEYNLPGGYHHDVFEKENGNLIVLSNNFEHNTVEDIIVEIDRSDGSIIKEIDLKEILNTSDGKSENWVDYDWFHNNSVWYDKDTNSLILSGRHQDIVLNINYDSLEINYILGDPQGFSDEYQKYFLKPLGDLEWQYAQHAAKIIPNGDLILFDNGINRSKDPNNYLLAKDNYSRGVVYNINQKDMTVSQVYQYGKQRGSDYYSSYISDIDYLNKEHYLIHSGGVAFKDGEVLNRPPGLLKADALRSYTTEIFNDKKIFELVLPNNNYRAQKMTAYVSNDKFNKTVGKSLGNLGQSSIDKNQRGLIFKTVTDQAFLDDYDITFTKESDRLVISGDFKPEDNVKIILYNNFTIKMYQLRVSKRPYTAMCLDIFNEDDKVSVSKYINDQGLDKRQTILIEINNVVYKTGLAVDFR
ncbi:MAG: aryl-sulfate sulfotransferase [Erysipelothrix sp.]|nr:aryl-sulfate sulfotransferase [Erysipelothrix sp.]